MVVEKAYGEYSDFRIPGMVATKKESLIRYCECRRTVADWADIDIKISRSEDCGKSWETVLVIESDGNTLNNPVMFVDGERLVFLYCKNYKTIWKRVSEDDGRTFGEAERVNFEDSVDFFYNAVAVGPGHGVSHNGRLIVPIWFAYDREDPKSHFPSVASTLYSEDGGKTFRVGEIIFPDKLSNASECALAVTADNEVLISIRHTTGKMRALAISSDGIGAWRDLRFEEKLPDPTCMGSMTHKNGRIYHSNCASSDGRVNLEIKITDDNFNTFRKIPVSDVGGYSDIALLGDKICILYEKTILCKDTPGRPFLPFELTFETFII